MRRLSLDEITWFLQALVEERDDFRRGMLLWLLTAARFSELIFAESEEIVDGVWTIGVNRAKMVSGIVSLLRHGDAH